PLAGARSALHAAQRSHPRRRYRHPADALRRLPGPRGGGRRSRRALVGDRGDRHALPPRPRVPRERAVRDALGRRSRLRQRDRRDVRTDPMTAVSDTTRRTSLAWTIWQRTGFAPLLLLV